ncbi:MAG: zinc-ribbon domain-containing protein [Clostridia bacterium]|nr:zinc-ribbon domain-containing protein [Clostridia bacterium]
MKFCSKCGTQIEDDAIICLGCGRMVDGAPSTAQPADSVAQSRSGFVTAAKVFLIIGTILMAIMTFGIGLAWCLPMTLSYFRRTKDGTPVSVGFKVCVCLFVSMLGGIFMFCDNK